MLIVSRAGARQTGTPSKSFKLATIKNASNSVKGAGIARLRRGPAGRRPLAFVRSKLPRYGAPARHKATGIPGWAERVADMLAEPRAAWSTAILYPAARMVMAMPIESRPGAHSLRRGQGAGSGPRPRCQGRAAR